MENVHSTKRSEQSVYTPHNTKEIVNFKEATNSNLNPRIGKYGFLAVSTSDEQFFLQQSLRLNIFSSKTKRNQESFTYKA